LRDLVDFGVTETYPQDALFPGSPGGTIPSTVSMLGIRDADAMGGEMAAELSLTRWLSVHANYSYQHITDANTGMKIKSAPPHKINTCLCLYPGQGFLISLFANYVDGTVWEEDQIDPYTVLNSVISFRGFGDRIEVSLTVANLLNNKHLEHPQGDEIGRSIALGLMYRID
jgi:hypothetical protein